MSLLDNIVVGMPKENCGVVGCWGKDEQGRTTLNGVVVAPTKSDLPNEGGSGKLPDAPLPAKVEINYFNVAIVGAIGGGAGYLAAKKIVKTDKVLLPILIGVGISTYVYIDILKKTSGASW